MLEIKNLHKTFHLDHNPENDKHALRGVDLTIGDDDFITVIGGNGSGKTTLLNMIAGVFAPDEGSIRLDGVDLTHVPEHKRAKDIGRVFQDPMLGTIADMSLFENMALAEKRGKNPPPFAWALTKQKKERYQEMLKPFGLGLEDRLEVRMGSFSGGQRQSVTLLMASMTKPKILLLDEHTAALDPKTAKTVMEMTDHIVRENHIPTLMITHNMRDAIAYGNRLIMMSEGRIIFDVRGEEKARLTVEDLLVKFAANRQEDDEISDSMILG